MKCEDFRADFYLLREAPHSPEARALRRHLAECPECARYADEMCRTLDCLTPRHSPESPAAFRQKMQHLQQKAAALADESASTRGRRSRMWRAVAVVALVVGCGALLSLFLLPSRLSARQPLAPAEASAYFARALSAQPRTLQIELSIRTPRSENFAAIDADSAFVTHRITTLREGNRLLWRIAKQGGRTAVCDGERQWMWSPGFDVCVTGPATSGFVEYLSVLLRPEEILAAEQEAAERGEGIGYELQETDYETRLTVNAPRQGAIRRGTGLDHALGSAENTRQYVFDRASGRLKSFRITLRRNGRDVEVARSESIRYDEPVDRALLLALPELPPLADGSERQWHDVSREESEGIARRRSARTAARRIGEAFARGSLAPVAAAFGSYPDTVQLLRVYGGMTVEEVGDAYRSGSYVGYYVPLRCTLKDGRKVTLRLALRNDNPARAWTVDGGI